MQRSTITWNDVVKKEAKGLNDFSFGEVQAVGTDYVYTEKGTISKHKYYLPKALVRGFDGKILWFNISESQAQTEFKRENAPAAGEFGRYTGYTASDTVPMV